MKNNPQSDVALSIAAQVLLGPEFRNSNAILSPASIQAMLSLIAAGAKGPTLDRLLSFLKAESIEDLNSLSSKLVSNILNNLPEIEPIPEKLLPFLNAETIEKLNSLNSSELNSSRGRGAKLLFVNGIWVDESLPPLSRSFEWVASDVHQADSRRVDFQNQGAKVVDEVNEWAKKHTNGIIDQVLSPSDIDEETRLVLANALYFKGAWRKKFFDPSETEVRDFHLMDGTQTRVCVPFMTTKTNQYIAQFDGFKVMSLPYKRGKGRKFSMCIFLPDSRTGLPALVQKMGSESGFVEAHNPSCEVEVGEFWIPKFKILSRFEASGALREMGLDLGGVELSGMVEEECGGVPVRVSSVLHKAFVEVNEKGTKAAAVNVAHVKLTCVEPPRKLEKMDFVAEHPFVFLIRDDLTGTVLFVGQVLDPSMETEDVLQTR